MEKKTTKRNTLINYTTEVEVKQTVGEIVNVLIAKDARNVWIEKDGADEPKAVRFAFPFPGLPAQFIDYKIEANWQGALETMKKKSDIPPRYCNSSQAKRTVWRTIKYMIEMLIGMSEMQQGQLEQLFFSHAIDSKEDEFVFFQLTEFKQKQLNAEN